MIRGVKEAKDLSEYDNLAAAAYLRAKEDYLMGINFFFCLGVDPDTFFLLVFADIGLLVYQTVDVFSLSSGVSADVDRINVFSIKQ